MSEHIQYIVAFGMPGGWEWMIILLVALLIFGRRLPDIARSMGRSLTEFKKGINEAKETKDDLMNDVNQIKDDVEKDARNAAGMDDSNNTN